MTNGWMEMMDDGKYVLKNTWMNGCKMDKQVKGWMNGWLAKYMDDG